MVCAHSFRSTASLASSGRAYVCCTRAVRANDSLLCNRSRTGKGEGGRKGWVDLLPLSPPSRLAWDLRGMNEVSKKSKSGLS